MNTCINIYLVEPSEDVFCMLCHNRLLQTLAWPCTRALIEARVPKTKRAEIRQKAHALCVEHGPRTLSVQVSEITDPLGLDTLTGEAASEWRAFREEMSEFTSCIQRVNCLREGLLEQSVAALQAARQEGVRTIVEVTTFDLGRDIGLIQEVSRRSGVQIIAATGNHLAVPRPFGDISPDVIARLYIREIEEGIEGTGIKAGIIKVASDRDGITPPQEVILRAAARTHHRTGLPISTHTWSPDRVGEQQVRILEEEGVDLNRVYIGHSNDDTDLGYLLGLLEKGVWLGMDRNVRKDRDGFWNPLGMACFRRSSVETLSLRY